MTDEEPVPAATMGEDENTRNLDDNPKHDDRELEKGAMVELATWQVYYAWFVSDVLLYIVVLNLASELVKTIRIDRFSISLFVAVTLKIVLDIIQRVEHKIQHLFCHELERKVLGAFFIWLVLFSSKFLILWLDDYVFGNHVDLGYLWEVLVLSIVLIIVEKLSRLLFRRLGAWERKRTNTAQPVENTNMQDDDDKNVEGDDA